MFVVSMCMELGLGVMGDRCVCNCDWVCMVWVNMGDMDMLNEVGVGGSWVGFVWHAAIC